MGARDRTTRASASRVAALGATLAVVEATAAAASHADDAAVRTALGLGLAAAVVLSRYRSLVGLVLLVLLVGARVVSDAGTVTDELAAAAVMFHCARHGGRAALWASGLLVPAAYVLSGSFLVTPGTEAARRVGASGLTDDPAALALLVIAVASPLALPWLLGFALRWRARAESHRLALMRAEAESEARQQQAELARDVHDVVGHSLAVILAQAESVRYLEVETPPEVLGVLDSIAGSARTSLLEVRAVLTAGAPRPDPSDLDALVLGVATSGTRLVDRVLGTPRPLPPDLATVARRVLQEMLANALKHGDGNEVDVLRDWRRGLRIVVTSTGAARASEDGRGLAGMRQRVQAAHGELEVHRERDRFTVEARLPLPVSDRRATVAP